MDKTITTEIYGETFSVRADWSNAARIVEQLGEEGWEATKYQVADFRHDAVAALRQVTIDSLSHGGEVDIAAVDQAVRDAIES